jgi:hypothetical protein
VNDLAELGVKIGDRCFFLYKGDSIEYKDGLHDDGTPMLYRIVGKREFGEVCRPLHLIIANVKNHEPISIPYTQKLIYTPGLSFGQPEDGDWRPINSQA